MENASACVLGPWPRAFLSLASRGSVLGKAVLGLGLGFFLCPWPRIFLCPWPCVLDSTSDHRFGGHSPKPRDLSPQNFNRHNLNKRPIVITYLKFLDSMVLEL